MRAFLRRLEAIAEIQELIRRVEDGGCPAAATGLQPVQRSCVGASVALAADRPAVFVCGDEREARQMAADLRGLTGTEPVLLLEREWQFRPDTVVSRERERDRLAAFYRCIAASAAEEQEETAGNLRVIVATADALIQRTLPPECFSALVITLSVGGRADLRDLTARLIAAGYSRCEEVEGPGQFAVRGGILDVFSPQMDQPVRCEFFDDEIDSMGMFDPGTQRRTHNVSGALILPAAEVLPYGMDTPQPPAAAAPLERGASQESVKPPLSRGGSRGGTSPSRGASQENVMPPLAKEHSATPPLAKEHSATPPLAKEHSATPPLLRGGSRGGVGDTSLAAKLEKLASRIGKKRAELANTLRSDAEHLRGGADPGGLDRYLAAVYPSEDGAIPSSAIRYLPKDAVVFLCDTGRVEERIRACLSRTRQDAEALMESGLLAGEFAQVQLSAEEFYAALADFPVIMANALPTSRYPYRPKGLVNLIARQLSSYGGSLDTAAADLEQYRKSGVAVLALCASDSRALNLHRLLEERGIPAVLDLKGVSVPPPGEVRIAIGALSAGCEWPSLRLAVLSEGQLLEIPRRQNKIRQSKHASNRQKLQSYTDLAPGDLVVHVHHGIGRFAGMERMPVDGVTKDYLKILYAGGDTLYVPATQLDQVGKYIGTGGEDSAPAKLNKLGGTGWERQKSKAKKAVQDLARGLTQLYAERQRRPGYAFSPDSTWQKEFEEAFPYDETEDQLRAIAEIKADMETPRPMDRLLCGDVGYGKTEVALRAVMKCALDGKQAAILVPTTVLAQQHYATAVGRFRDFPVKIETLSRFTSSRDARRILAEARAGTLDLLIGTHKLLQKSVSFKNLGLLVIDEEQRFGVTHKERLKEISRQVDVLTLSATPIPRTLNMALSGLRDMSTIDEPPAGRQPVQTYVMEHDWGLLLDAIRRELDRGGQVYYLHNRVESIARSAVKLQEALGSDVRVVVGHGRMGEQELSEVMRQMVDGEADVLVCTTIIETGIDIPNVNTLIIEDADYMGLAQLHQIRGRIGRSARRAYAYLTYRPGKILQETAAKRLAAIREYVEFGSGFKIAMRDLEIRGAGNLLGPEQSGYLMSVGYDMYLKLLEEAVLEERGEAREIECSADLTVDANISEKYVPDGGQRMDVYRRIAAIRTQEDASDLVDELLDRYGEPPKAVLALIDVALLRAAAAKEGVSDITQKGTELRLTFAAIQPETVLSLCALGKYHRRLTVSGGDVPVLTLRVKKDALDEARELIEDLRLAGEAHPSK